MRLHVFSIRDDKVEVFGSPLCARGFGEAERFFGELQKGAQGEDSKISKHPHDFSLWHVGFWDDEKGEFELVDKVMVMNGKEM